MTTPNAEPTSRWDSIKKWVVGLTSILLVVPALINSGIDVYRAMLELPRTEAEQVSVRLFKKYFNKPPVTILPLAVKNNGVTYDAKFSIYEEGDIYVQYGSFTQWFPFPETNRTNPTIKTGWSPISAAHAQENPNYASGPFQQTDTIQGTTLIRRRIYENGAIEEFVIDMRTGAIVNYVVTPPSRVNNPPPSGPLKPNAVAPYAVIDLDQRRNDTQADHLPATVCTTPIGTCEMLQPAPRGIPCYCPTSLAGPVKGITR